MKIQPTQSNKPAHSFGILKSYKKTSYGDYTVGLFKGKKIEIFNAYKHNQKLIYVSDNLLNWIKSKLIYFQDGVKKVVRSENKKAV